MGATVTTGKEVCAIRDPKTGFPVYLLFEQTYEKNCYPHTPQWSCCFLGHLHDAVKTIFARASSCEGGMLQGRGGHLTPEGYIQGWMKALETPLAYPDKVVEMVVGDNWRAFMTQEGFVSAKAALAGNQGASALLERLELAPSGRIDLPLHENIGAFAAILEVLERRFPWALVSHEGNLKPDVELGHAPKKAKNLSDLVLPQVVRIDQDERLMPDKDGVWRSAGWAYSIVGKFIENAWSTEMTHPGSYKARIKAFREAVQNAPLVEFPIRVRIDRSNTLNIKSWEVSALSSFIENASPAANDADVYLLSEPEARDARYAGRAALIWEPIALTS